MRNFSIVSPKVSQKKIALKVSELIRLFGESFSLRQKRRRNCLAAASAHFYIKTFCLLKMKF